ncbi:alpha/beta fold hydrolase [Halomonas sp. MCCC 1A11081]|uniref:Alpha/beta fold hydrolase n=1 Tax=Billgrantia ethanolica TaxID=2733486 RepID=A0ABS9A636_9GAMM|nr:alpha/beta fold hydrolase [Halomonas ethanolica]
MSDFLPKEALPIDSARLREWTPKERLGSWFVEAIGPLEVKGDGSGGCLLIAHGAGAGRQSPYMSRIREMLAHHGVQTLAIEFAYMQRMQREGRRIPPPRIDRLVEELSQWCDILTRPEGGTLWLGGKSMGGRVASLLAASEEVAGLVLCGYPFHPPGKPERLRLSHWPSIECPTLVVQGTRDPFGTREEVEGYALPEHVKVHWLSDGDHDWTPRRSSGRSQAALIEEGAATIAAFMKAHH